MTVLSCPSWAVDRTSVLNCCWTEPVPFGQIAVPLLTRLHLRSKRWMSLRSRLRLSQQNMAEPLVGWRALPPRSGTNTFHGSLYELFRNEALDANAWFNDLNIAADPANAANFRKTNDK